MQPTPGLVAILAYDGLCTFEFGIAVEIFGLARPEFDFPWYEHRIVAVDQGPMRAMGGIQVLADGGMELLEDARTIIIPGWRDRKRRCPTTCSTPCEKPMRGGRDCCRSAPVCLCWRRLVCWTDTAPPRIGATPPNWPSAFRTFWWTRRCCMSIPVN